jgi:hypothetical protein
MPLFTFASPKKDFKKSSPSAAFTSAPGVASAPPGDYLARQMLNVSRDQLQKKSARHVSVQFAHRNGGVPSRAVRHY